jgi:hypothetical protein
MLKEEEDKTNQNIPKNQNILIFWNIFCIFAF